jgi:hypothetical protein
MRSKFLFYVIVLGIAALANAPAALAWTPVTVTADPNVRMPGTQPNQVTLEAPTRCLNCHAGYNTQVEPGFNWKGSMMAHAARDFIFWSCFTVAAQDSIWAVGNPNATDICERCHFPKGWLEGRSDPTNASLMTGADFDGVQCDLCHTMYDPFFETTHSGAREGSDWTGYWDEATSEPLTMADSTYQEDSVQALKELLFNGSPFYNANQPASPSYTENGSAQMFMSSGSQKRASFADAAARHQMFYSRYHKSKYFCNTCHDISNPVLANLGADPSNPLPTEANSAYSYYHVERTFSEFMLSDYGRQGGAAGMGPFSPSVFKTSNPGNYIDKCQDCHMRDVVGVGCNKNGAPIRPDQSLDHPQSGEPLHDLTGGNAFVSYVLASAVPGSSNYDPVNDQLLHQGAGLLTLDLAQGEGIDPAALLAGVDRAKQQLQLAAVINNLSYDTNTGTLSFHVQNQTGHKLISGFPEGRRMFVNIKAYKTGSLIYEVNPYDYTAGTLKGLGYPYDTSSLPAPQPLGPNEVYVDELVYETHTSSSLTGESESSHFALATGRHKDNRIPPKGFRIAEAASRLCVPVWDGADDPGYFTSAEYAGGYDAVSIVIPPGADSVEVTLNYQTTAREYMEFLRDEIKGTGNLTLSSPTPSGEPAAYVAQTDPFFAKLAAWGDTIWQLWSHNMNVPGAAPIMMARSTIGVGGGCQAPVPSLLGAVPGNGQVTLTWSDMHTNDPNVTGYAVYYDQAGKAQPVATVGLTTTYTDTGLTNGQEYCYKVTSLYSGCESAYSNVLCAIPNNQGQAKSSVSSLDTGLYQKSGKGRNATTTFVLTTTFTLGDNVVVRAHVADKSTGLPIANATVTISVTGPESVSLTTGPSGTDGVAEATWQTQAPNKHGIGGTTPGTYTSTVTDVSATGYAWDGTMTTVSFDIQ